MVHKSEFTIPNAYPYDHRSAARWIFSHIWRHKLYVFGLLIFGIAANATQSQAQVFIGQAASQVLQPEAGVTLAGLALSVTLILALGGVTDLVQSLSTATLAQRLEASTREELQGQLLGKSQTFHDRQRVGDIMAMATDDVVQLNVMINPGIFFIYNTIIGIAIPMLFIATMNVELLLVPALFIVAYIFAVRLYTRQLNPVAYKQRDRFGKMNASLEESISGIELVKSAAREGRELHKFKRNAALYRGFFVRQGYVEARYLPILLFAISVGMAFLHAVSVYQRGGMTLAQIVAFMGLLNLLRFPTFISIWSFSVVELGMAGARRILGIIRAEADLDQNKGGHTAAIEGDIRFEGVSFNYGGSAIIDNLTFHVKPGETVAIVGQTGSGKSTLTQLVNRTYDATAGRILIDGVDVREWNLTSLRSQIAKIEQDIFLFSRSIGDNIAFGAPDATREQIEQAAKEAQAHEFILSFKEGYDTVVGERGVMLSGGQRQRIALARAFLSSPRILILDDSTSAIDSATEDEIQKAIGRAQQGRTTLLITHRLSQIRWADHILLLDAGALIGTGTHDELLRTSPHYRRIFARYNVELPPLEGEPTPETAEQVSGLVAD